MNSLISGLQNLTLSDFPLTESHLQELTGYSSVDLQSSVTLLNREISEQYVGNLGERRIRKNGKDQPFTFTITSIAKAVIEVQIILPLVFDRGNHKKTKKLLNILVDFSSSTVAVTVKKAALYRFCTYRSSQAVDLEIGIIDALAKNTSCVSVPIVKRYMSKEGQERAALEFPRAENTLDLKQMNIKDSLLVLHKVGKMLQEIHNAGFVFHNVRADKFLISNDPDLQVQLKDFYLTRENGRDCVKGSSYIYWDHCAQEGRVFTNSDVFGLAVTTCQVLIPSFIGIFQNPEIRSWLLTEYGQAKFLCFILLDSFSELYEPLLDRPYDTAKLIDCLEKVYNREKENPRDSFFFEVIDRILKVTKIQAAAIAIMANEEKGSLDLAMWHKGHYRSDEDVKDFLENARKEMPWLSTAESSAEQLYKLYLEAPATTTLGHYLPALAEGLNYPLSQMMSGSIQSYSWRVYNEMKVQLLERKNERRISKRDSGMPFTYVLSSVTTPSVTAQIIFPKTAKDARLGQGTYKQIKRSFSYSITFQSSKEAVCSIKRTALHRFKKTVSLKSAICGIENHINLMKKLPVDSFVVPVPIIRQYVDRNGKPRIEMETAAYDQDLSSLTYRSTTRQFFFLLSKAAETIQQIHDVGFVHRDVHAKNILVKQNEKREFEAYINDFDLLGPIGYTDEKNVRPCAWWDACSNSGIALPNCDVYGLAATAFNALIPDVNRDRKKIHALMDENEKIALLLTQIRKYYPRFSSQAKTLDELIEEFDATYCKRRYSFHEEQRLVKANYEVIRIMAREEKNSEDLLQYYTDNPSMHNDIAAFLVKAKEAIPTLSTGASIAKELLGICRLFC